MSARSDGAELARRYSDIHNRIRAAAGARVDAVTLIAVSKTVEVDRVEALYRLGQRDFGENYAQELAAKATELTARGLRDIRWHFIGHLQTNKVKLIIPFVHAVHTVDSARLAAELGKRWASSGRLPVFIEVNIDREAGKSGAAPEEARALATEVAAQGKLDLRGLMCVPRARAPGENAELRASFKALRDLGQECGISREFSMGMSGDFDIALAEGATHIRVGTALFGTRPAP